MVTKGKRAGRATNRLTLKAAEAAVWTTPEGRRRLDLSNAGLAAFPRCLLKLSGLDELDLSRNRIRSLPDRMGALSSLQRLDLHSNRLEALPADAVGQLTELTHLDLANNRLTAAGLPPTLGRLSRLRSLNLGLNRLDALPAAAVARLGALRELALFDNLFTEMPAAVAALAGLARLNAERNPLTAPAAGSNATARRGGVGGVDSEERWERGEAMYLVKESALCEPCLQRCREERTKRMKTQEGRGAGVLGEKRVKRTYSGLMTPNSVAVLNQDIWRCRMEKSCT